MKTKDIGIRYDETITARVPENSDIANLEVGDLAPDCFGRLSEVTEIYHVGTDIHGSPFVCYYTKHGSNGSVSNAMKAGELMRSVALVAMMNSAQLDDLEASLR